MAVKKIIVVDKTDPDVFSAEANGNVVAYANHDEHGYAGMSAVEDAVNSIAEVFNITVQEFVRNYDLKTMTGFEIDQAIEELLGQNEENYGEYYSDYTGANAFWHLLAGTQSTDALTIPDSVTKKGDSVVVENLGVFTKIEDKSSYDETGDLDHVLIYQVGDRFFKKECNLDSWDGGLWDGRSRAVKAVEKTIMVWE